MPENWWLLYFGEARATLVDYTMTRELKTLLAAAVLTSSVFRNMKFSRMLTDSRNSQKLRNASISADTVYICAHAKNIASQGKWMKHSGLTALCASTTSTRQCGLEGDPDCYPKAQERLQRHACWPHTAHRMFSSLQQPFPVVCSMSSHLKLSSLHP